MLARTTAVWCTVIWSIVCNVNPSRAGTAPQASRQITWTERTGAPVVVVDGAVVVGGLVVVCGDVVVDAGAAVVVAG